MSGNVDKMATIVATKMAQYRQKELMKFIGRKGLIVHEDFGYQDPTMYVVVFNDKAKLEHALFFEYEVKIGGE